MLYSDYLELDADQNGMLSVGELMRFRGGAPPGGGLTAPFVQRVFQDCHHAPQTALAPRSHSESLRSHSESSWVIST